MTASYSAIPNAGVRQGVTDQSAGITVGDIPGGAYSAEGYVRGELIERRDAGTPTNDFGTPWGEGDLLYLRTRSELRSFRAVTPTATGRASVDWVFFNVTRGEMPPGLRRPLLVQEEKLVPIAEEQLQELKRIRLGSEMALEEDLSVDDAEDTGISN